MGAISKENKNLTQEATQQTLDYYDKNAQEFVADTVSVDLSAIHNEFLKYVPIGGHILDLGCGSGRDSKVFIEAGYKVTAVDGSKEMCQLASKLIGLEVVCAQFNELVVDNEFDGIWASASLLHISSSDLSDVLQSLIRSLKPKGILYMSFKWGDFEGHRNGRYFTDMTEEKLQQVVEALPSISAVMMQITCDVRPGRQHVKWLNAIVRKI